MVKCDLDNDSAYIKIANDKVYYTEIYIPEIAILDFDWKERLVGCEILSISRILSQIESLSISINVDLVKILHELLSSEIILKKFKLSKRRAIN